MEERKWTVFVMFLLVVAVIILSWSMKAIFQTNSGLGVMCLMYCLMFMFMFVKLYKFIKG